MSATLKLTHKAIGVEVRRGTYDVVLDGEQLGAVAMNDTFETPIEAGHHSLQLHRKELLADLSVVLPRPQPGDLGPSPLDTTGDHKITSQLPYRRSACKPTRPRASVPARRPDPHQRIASLISNAPRLLSHRRRQSR